MAYLLQFLAFIGLATFAAWRTARRRRAAGKRPMRWTEQASLDRRANRPRRRDRRQVPRRDLAGAQRRLQGSPDHRPPRQPSMVTDPHLAAPQTGRPHKHAALASHARRRRGRDHLGRPHHPPLLRDPDHGALALHPWHFLNHQARPPSCPVGHIRALDDQQRLAMVVPFTVLSGETSSGEVVSLSRRVAA